MLKLTLLRHAKSSWAYLELDDLLRPLNRRGYRQGQDLANGFPADVDEIWCSPAIRAYSTAQCLLQSRPDLTDKLVIKDEIYEAGTETLLRMLMSADSQKHIVIVGHNPDLELLANLLTDSNLTMKTAHRAQLTIELEHWGQLKPGCAKLASLWRPEA